MKLQASIPFPLGPYETITREAAESFVGKTMPLRGEDGHDVGMCSVVSVDWQSSTNVRMLIELDVGEEVEAILQEAYERGRLYSIKRLEDQRENRENN